MENTRSNSEKNNSALSANKSTDSSPLEKDNTNSSISTHLTPSSSKEEIISKAIKIHSNGNILEAEKYYEYFINQGFTDYRFFSNYGILLRRLGKLQKAINYHRKAIDLKPDFANAYFNLGTVLIDLGRFEEAKILTRKAIEINPNFAEAYSNLGNIMRDLGKLEEAEILQRKAVKLLPELAELHSNLSNVLKDLGKLKEAEISIRKSIELDPHFTMAYSNLGGILIGLGKLNEAEISTRKAIKLDPSFAEAYANLGSILINLGKLDEAEKLLYKSIQIKPSFAKAYFSISNLKFSKDNNKLKHQLFSQSILNRKSKSEQIDIFFARSNFLHKENKFKESSRYLQLANKIKLDIRVSKPDILINKSRSLLLEDCRELSNRKEYKKYPDAIFIVGMPRSGSTLIESILSMNSNISDLGEVNILEKAFLEWKHHNQRLSLEELYWKKSRSLTKELNITTNKWLYNYQYAGIIASHITSAKIIHCYRNPLDNILSIYRAHFANGNDYSSSLVDSARVYLDQEDVMTEYKNRFRSRIYDLNYDLLVSAPKKEIKSLISWLGWEWDAMYLSPHLNPRSVSTASSIQVRSPINSKSINVWKNYKNLLRPAIKIIKNHKKFQNLRFYDDI